MIDPFSEVQAITALTRPPPTSVFLVYISEDAAEEAQKAADEDTKFLNTVIAGNLEEAERMILSGISASCVDDQLRTPLHYAAYNGDRDMAALLCDYDADIEAFDASVRRL